MKEWKLVSQQNIIWETFLLKNHTQNMMDKLFPDPSLKIQNWAYLWVNNLKFYEVCFYCMTIWQPSNILQLSRRPLAFTSYNVFFWEKSPRPSLPSSFSAWFLKKNIYLIIFYEMTKFRCLVVFTLWDIGQHVYCNYYVNQVVTS